MRWQQKFASPQTAIKFAQTFIKQFNLPIKICCPPNLNEIHPKALSPFYSNLEPLRFTLVCPTRSELNTIYVCKDRNCLLKPSFGGGSQ